MKQTFDLSLQLCISGWNTYAVMAISGSQLYKNVIEKQYKLSDDYNDYLFHAYNTQSLYTEYLSS